MLKDTSRSTTAAAPSACRPRQPSSITRPYGSNTCEYLATRYAHSSQVVLATPGFASASRPRKRVPTGCRWA